MEGIIVEFEKLKNVDFDGWTCRISFADENKKGMLSVGIGQLQWEALENAVVERLKHLDGLTSMP